MKALPNWLDIAIVTVLIRACYRGYTRGSISELLSLFGAVSVTACTVNYSGLLTQSLLQWFQYDPTVVTFLMFWLIFLTTAVAIRLLIRYAAVFFAWERRHWISQALGLLLGASRGLWWSAVIIVALSSSNIHRLQASVEHSLLGAAFAEHSYGMLEQTSGYFPGAGNRRKAPLFPPAKAAPKRAAR